MSLCYRRVRWSEWLTQIYKNVNWNTSAILHQPGTSAPSFLLVECVSLSFRLWIPQVRGQPHGFSFSIQLDSWHPPRWAAGPPCCAWRCRSISFSVFLCSVVHPCLPPRSAWHNHPLLAVVYAHTISLSLASRTLSVIHATPRMRRMSSFL